MHASVSDWVAAKVTQHHLSDLSVLECGSLNVNGSVRQFFTGPYLGTDMQDGPGVDQVIASWDLTLDRCFDVVVSTEMFEHDKYFWKSMKTMTKALRPNGWFLLTTRGIDFPFHEYPGDYWRFTEDAVAHLFVDAGLQVVEVVPDPEQSGVFGLAKKLVR